MFSAYSNMEKIMAVKMNNPREISCLHGIRFYDLFCKYYEKMTRREFLFYDILILTE